MKVPIYAILFLSVILLLAGCWNYRELEQLGIVTGIGIDRGKSWGTVILTAQIIKPTAVQSGGESGKGGSGQSAPVIVKSIDGASPFDAARNFLKETSRRLYFPHSQIIVFGREQAEQGVKHIVDFFIRDNEPRPTTQVLIAKGNAAEILKSPGEIEKVSAYEIASMLRIQRSLSQNATVNLQEFLSSLISKTTAAVAPMIEINPERSQNRFRLCGSAVFKEDRLIGELTEHETRGLLWVKGKVRSGVIVVRAPGGKASFEIMRSSVKIKAKINNGQPLIELRISEVGNLDCQMSEADLSKPEMLRKLAQCKATVIRNEIEAAIAKAKRFNADIFGFGEVFHREDPNLWRKIEPRWQTLFPQLRVTMDIRSTIPLVGLTFKPIVPQP